MASRATVRRKKAASYKSFKLAKRIRPTYAIPSSYTLLRQSLRLLWARKKMFGGILFIYGLLYLVFVQGIGGNVFSVHEVKEVITESYGGGGSAFLTALTFFGALILTGSSAPDE